MLFAFVAALALVSCNKHDNDPVQTNMKSVEISLTNVKYETKGAGLPAGEEIQDGDPIQLNTVQFFFSDGSNLYTPYQADGVTPAVTYFSDASQATGAALSFHSLPPAVTKVIVIGNHPEITTNLVSDLDVAITAATQQDPKNVVLFDEEGLVLMNTNHNTEQTGGGNPHNTSVYSATITLVPKIARFEILNFSCEFSTPPLYNSVEIHKIHFADRYDQVSLRNNTYGDLRSIDLSNQTTIFNHLNNHTTATWFNDLFTPAISLTPTAPSVATNLAYNFIPSTMLPRFVLALSTNATDPAYLYTVHFVDTNGNVLDEGTDYQPGKIYRIKDFKFKDTDLVHQDKCVEIVLEVLAWDIVYVSPVF